MRLRCVVMIESRGEARRPFAYEVTAYVERGWWLVHAVDIGHQVRVSTLAEVELAGRRLYANALSCAIDDISIEVSVYRTRPDAVVRTVWRRAIRRRAA